MKYTIAIDGRNVDFEISLICPYCSLSIVPQIISCSSVVESYDECCFILQCPSCDKMFFAKFTYYDNKMMMFRYPSIYPTATPPLGIPHEIKDIYPEFYTLYQQSIIAEAHNLTEIMGMGYRKSLEFLVKAYVTKCFPDNENVISHEPLSHSIARIKVPKLQALAKAACWIGNDETHVERRHPEYGVPEMKTFIRALSYLIVSENVSDESLKLIHP